MEDKRKYTPGTDPRLIAWIEELGRREHERLVLQSTPKTGKRLINSKEEIVGLDVGRAKQGINSKPNGIYYAIGADWYDYIAPR